MGPGSVSPGRARHGLRALLEAMDVPAFVLSTCMDVVAANGLADAVLAVPPGSASRNAAKQVFLDPAARALYPDWAKVAGDTVAHLRLMTGRHPHDRALFALIGELTIGSDDFVRLWSRQEVMVKSHGTKLLAHPSAGRLGFAYETFVLPEDLDQILVTYTPTDPETHAALSVLALGDRAAVHASAPAAALPTVRVAE